MSKKTGHVVLAGLVCLSAALIGGVDLSARAGTSTAVDTLTRQDDLSGRVKEAPAATITRPLSLTSGLGCVRVLFVRAAGPAESRPRFRAQGTNKTIYFAPDGVTVSTSRPNAMLGKSASEPQVVKVSFLGAREDVVPEELDEADAGPLSSGAKPEAKKIGAAAYSEIFYRDVWPGIDLVYKAGTDRLDCEFIVHPGADPSRIKLVYGGAETIALTKEGRLAIRTPAGDFEEDVPGAYQEIDGLRKRIDVTLSLEDASLSQSAEGEPAPATSPTNVGPILAMGFDVGPYERTRTLVLDTASGYFGRKTGTTSIEVTGGHAGGSQFTLSTGQWIARIGVLGYMKNAPATGTLAIYKNTAIPDIKQHVCHTVTGAMPVGSSNKAWTVLEVADGPAWLEPGDYWILRNDSGDYSNKFVITGQDMGKSSWGWFYTDFPAWPATTQYLSWVENYSNVEGCFYAEWDGGIPGPTLTSLAPNSADAGDPGFLLSVTGSGFVEGAVVRWGGSSRPTTWVSSTEVDAEIASADLAAGKTVWVSVMNPNGGISNALPFAIHNPVPSLTSISPTQATGGGSAFTLTAVGSNFVPNSVVRWNGSARTTTFVSATALQGAIKAADLGKGGPIPVTVYNPAPSGGTTVALTVEVSTFTMAASPASATVTAGQSATYEIQLTPQHGAFPSPVSFACSGLPSNTTASFSPDSVTPGAGSATTTLTLTTKAETSPSAAAPTGIAGPPPAALGLVILLATLLLAFVSREDLARRLHGRLLAAVALAGLILLAGSCGSNATPTGTPKGTHQVTVKGTSGTMTVSTVVTLVVK